MAAPHPGRWKPIFVKPPNAVTQPNTVLDTHQIAAHAMLICTDLEDQEWKVLYGYPVNRESPTPLDNFVKTRIWNPDPDLSNPITFQSIPDWPNQSDKPVIFCGGHTFFSDGRILWVGGMRLGESEGDAPHFPDADIWGNNFTYIFNPTIPDPNQWSIAGGELTPHTMANDRYYPTLIHLGVVPSHTLSGKIIAMSGWIDFQDVEHYTLNREPEYYDETNSWQPFPYSGATQPFNGPFDYYPSCHLVPAGANVGKLFFSLPMKQSYIFNPFWNGVPNGGYWQSLGSARNDYRLNGTSTLLPLLPPYDSAKVIILGGSPSEDEYASHAMRSAEIIDIASSNPQWSSLGDLLFFARKNHVNIMLPNDMLFVVAGNEFDFEENPVYSAELIDTTQSSLSSAMLPGHVYPREHHTTALLLPDATVWLAGSGHVEDADRVPYAEIYEPGYIFEGTRPTILTGPDNNTISYNTNFNIETDVPIFSIRLIRFGAVTHSTDMSQLSVGLFFTAGTSNGTYSYDVTSPPDANIAPPGMYMLFVMRPKNASLSLETLIPSIAKLVMLQ